MQVKEIGGPERSLVHIDTGFAQVTLDESFTAHSGQQQDLNSLVPVMYDHAIKAEDTPYMIVWWMIFRLRGGQSSHVPAPWLKMG